MDAIRIDAPWAGRPCDGGTASAAVKQYAGSVNRSARVMSYAPSVAASSQPGLR